MGVGGVQPDSLTRQQPSVDDLPQQGVAELVKPAVGDGHDDQGDKGPELVVRR